MFSMQEHSPLVSLYLPNIHSVSPVFKTTILVTLTLLYHVDKTQGTHLLAMVFTCSATQETALRSPDTTTGTDQHTDLPE